MKTALLITAAPVAFEAGYAPTPAMVRQAKEAQDRNEEQRDAMLARSKDSAAMIDYWDKTDAIVDGIDALRLAGEKFLPRFSDEAQPEYDFRKKLTKLTNVYRDIVEGLASKPFEKEIVLVDDDESASVPADIKTFVEDVDGAGNNLTMFGAAVFFNGINSAIDWIYVDFPKPDQTIRTVADEKAAGIRPYWSRVLGRNILEARSRVINGNETLEYIRIYEPGAPDHVRVFNRVGSVVTWELWRKTLAWHDMGGGLRTMFAMIDEGTLTIDEIPLVPFITGRREGRTWKLAPPMRDAADLQIELFQQESGLKFAKTLTAYPMLTGNGVKPPMAADGRTVERIAVGPNRVLYAPPDNSGNVGSWSFIEPSAQSLTFLATDVKDTITQLRELGRQPLVATMGITVIQASMGASKGKSAVKAWAFSLQTALENALRITGKWKRISDYKATVQVFTEFDEFLDGKDLESLDADRDRRDISQETLWEEKKRRGVYGPDFTAEREKERLLAETPGDGEDTIDDPNAPGPARPKPKPKPGNAQ